MQWTTSITEAVTQSRSTKTPMIILLEPPTRTLTRPPNSPELLETLSTTALHRYLFTNPQVLRLLSAAKITGLRIVALEGNNDYESFKAYFQHVKLPDLLLVNFDGEVPWRKHGFTSPRCFVHNVARVCAVDTTGWFQPRERSALLVLPEKPAQQKSPSVSKPTTTITTTKPRNGLSLEKKKCVLRARLPNGLTVSHEYMPETRFFKVRAWLAEQCLVPGNQLLVSTAFPKYVFDQADDPKMISELGLVPSANVVVAIRADASGGGGDGGERVGAGVRDGVYAALAGGRDLLFGFFGSFFTVVNDGDGERERVERERVERERVERERVERERVERRRSIDDDDETLRYNGNSTQFGYDEDR